MSTVRPAMESGGNTSAQTNASGALFTAFAPQAARQLTIVNATGQDIEFQQNGTGGTVPVINGTAYPIYGLQDASQIAVRRIDQSNTQVTVKARWEY